MQANMQAALSSALLSEAALLHSLRKVLCASASLRSKWQNNASTTFGLYLPKSEAISPFISLKQTLKQFTTMAIGYGYSNRSDRYRHKPSLNLKTTMEKRELWKIVIQTLITILTAIGTSLGVVSCMWKSYEWWVTSYEWISYEW